jgi:hypothetical protein
MLGTHESACWLMLWHVELLAVSFVFGLSGHAADHFALGCSVAVGL